LHKSAGNFEMQLATGKAAVSIVQTIKKVNDIQKVVVSGGPFGCRYCLQKKSAEG
jgi:hypothetical protein